MHFNLGLSEAFRRICCEKERVLCVGVRVWRGVAVGCVVLDGRICFVGNINYEFTMPTTHIPHECPHARQISPIGQHDKPTSIIYIILHKFFNTLPLQSPLISPVNFSNTKSILLLPFPPCLCGSIPYVELFLLWLNLRKVRLDRSADLSVCSSMLMLLTVF